MLHILLHVHSLLETYSIIHNFVHCNIYVDLSFFKTPEMGKSVCKNTQRCWELSLSPPTKTDHAGAAITFDLGREHKI